MLIFNTSPEEFDCSCAFTEIGLEIEDYYRIDPTKTPSNLLMITEGTAYKIIQGNSLTKEELDKLNRSCRYTEDDPGLFICGGRVRKRN